MRLRFRYGVGALLLVLLVCPAITPAQARLGDEPPRLVQPRTVVERLSSIDARGTTRGGPGTSARLLGSDGKLYDPAPAVVEGRHGNWFLGADFDIACSDGRRFVRGLKRLARLTRLIERSGRRAVLVTPPNKSSVDTDDLQRTPHGRCARAALRDQESLLDSFDDPRFLPLRTRLASDDREVYYRTDTHWTTVGASLYAKRLAARMDERFARRLRYSIGSESRQGDLFTMLGIDDPEVAQTAEPKRPVTVVPSDGDPYLQQSWTSRPRTRVLGGSTLLIGDSFTYVGLPVLRPLFRRGRFIWTITDHAQSMVENIVRSDTVVIEVLQRFVSTSMLGTTDFYRQVRRALRHDGSAP